MTKQTELRIGGVPEHFNLPWHLAMEDKAFEKLPLQLHWQDYAGGTGAMAKDLQDNKLDMALLLTEGAIADIIRGSNYRIVSLYVDSPLIWGIHVHADSSYQQVEDIKGQTYAVSRHGSGSHLMAFVDARARDWSTRELKFEIVGSLEGARQALSQKSADAFMWEKYMTKPLVDSGEWRRIGQRPTPWPCFVVVVREEYMAQHAQVVSQVLQLVRHYAQQFKANPEAASLIAERYHLKPEDAQAWLQEVRWVNNSLVPVLMLEEVLDTLLATSLIPHKVLPEKLCFEQAQLV